MFKLWEVYKGKYISSFKGVYWEEGIMAKSAVYCPVCRNLMDIDGTYANVLHCAIDGLYLMNDSEYSNWTRS